jgi:hypothetical protein
MAAPSLPIMFVQLQFDVIGAFWGGHASLSCSACNFDTDAKHSNLKMHNLWISLGSNRCEAAPSKPVYGEPNRYHVVGAFGGGMPPHPVVFVTSILAQNTQT